MIRLISIHPQRETWVEIMLAPAHRMKYQNNFQIKTTKSSFIVRRKFYWIDEYGHTTEEYNHDKKF